MATEVNRFPQSSNELDQWRAQGRTFSGGKWFEPETTPTIEKNLKPPSDIEADKATLAGLTEPEGGKIVTPAPKILPPEETPIVPDETPDIDIDVGTDLTQTSDTARQKTKEDIEGEITAGAITPERLNLVDEYQSLRSEHGVTTLENDLNTTKASLRDLEQQIQDELTDEEGRLASMETISANQREIIKEKQKQIDRIVRRQEGIVDQLNMANSNITNIMDLMGKDFDAAQKDYEDRISMNLEIMDIMKTDESDANKANESQYNVMVGSIEEALKSGGITSFDAVDESTKLAIRSLEVRLGLPTGFSENILASINPEKKIKTTVLSKDKSSISYLYADGSSEVFTTGLTAEEGGGEEKLTDADRVNNARATAQAKIGTDGLIAWETYAKMASDWIAQGGTASDFKMAFPPETLMDADNVKDLPATLKPSGVGGGSSKDELYDNI